jgi:hypothetical protein
MSRPYPNRLLTKAVAPGAEHRKTIANSVSCGLTSEPDTSPGGATDPGTPSEPP